MSTRPAEERRPALRTRARPAGSVSAATAATATAVHDASGAGSRLRSLTLLIFVIGTVGLTCDLVLLGHFEDARQWAPLLLLPASLLVLAWHRTRPGHLGTRTFQGVMVLFIVIGVAGVWFHYGSNAAFELSLHPSMAGWEAVRESLSGPAPALAPSAIVQLGLLGLTYAYRHPFLERRPSRPDVAVGPSVVAHGSSRGGGVGDPMPARCRRLIWVSASSGIIGMRMLDTHAVARSLTDAEFTPAQADAITNAVRLAAERGDHVTSDQFTAGLAEVRTEIAALDTRLSTQIANLDTRLSTQLADLRTEQKTEIAGVRTEIAGVRTEIASLETRLIRWMVGTVLATATLTFGILRFLGG